MSLSGVIIATFFVILLAFIFWPESKDKYPPED